MGRGKNSGDRLGLERRTPQGLTSGFEEHKLLGERFELTESGTYRFLLPAERADEDLATYEITDSPRYTTLPWGVLVDGSESGAAATVAEAIGMIEDTLQDGWVQDVHRRDRARLGEGTPLPLIGTDA